MIPFARGFIYLPIGEPALDRRCQRFPLSATSRIRSTVLTERWRLSTTRAPTIQPDRGRRLVTNSSTTMPTSAASGVNDLSLGSTLRQNGAPCSIWTWTPHGWQSVYPSTLHSQRAKRTDAKHDCVEHDQCARQAVHELHMRDDLGGDPLKYPVIPKSSVASYSDFRFRGGHNDTNPFIIDELALATFRRHGQQGKPWCEHHAVHKRSVQGHLQSGAACSPGMAKSV